MNAKERVRDHLNVFRDGEADDIERAIARDEILAEVGRLEDDLQLLRQDLRRLERFRAGMKREEGGSV